MDLAKLIMFQARARENEPAVAFTGGVATYGMLARATLSAVGQLERAGIGAGAVIAIDVRNPFHHIVLILALGLRGIVSASVQTSFNTALSGLKPDAVLVDAHAKQPDDVSRIPVDENWFLIDPQTPPDFARLMALPGFSDENDVVRVIFSSGTTGVPKSTGFTSAALGRRLMHAAFLHGGGGIAGMRAMTLMGFSTVAGYMVAIGALASGGVVCLAGHPAEALHLIRMFRVSFFTLAVAQLEIVLRTLGNARPPDSLETVIVGGSKVPLELLTQARSRLCANVTFGYGTTETGTISHAPGSFLAFEEGAAGYVVPWVTLQAVDGDYKPLPPGAEGVFRVRTDEQAYYVADDPENRLLHRDGWFYPGDIGTVREDGLVVVTGRSVEVINRGGSIVAPDLVERVLLQFPGIREAAAFGVPKSSGIDELWTAVVTDGPINEQEIILFCRERLADKAPEVIQRVSELPRAESGKVRRRQLRDDVLSRRRT